MDDPGISPDVIRITPQTGEMLKIDTINLIWTRNTLIQTVCLMRVNMMGKGKFGLFLLHARDLVSFDTQRLNRSHQPSHNIPSYPIRLAV